MQRISLGNPELSSILYRMETLDPDDRMPPMGTSLVDEKATALIREWIESLESCR